MKLRLILLFFIILNLNSIKGLGFDRPHNRLVAQQTDSLYKTGDFLIPGISGMRFEVIQSGSKSTLRTKGDTLYHDKQYTILGDLRELTGFGIYKKYQPEFKFEDFKAKMIYKGRLADPNFKTFTQARSFRTLITNECRARGINFAGHYTIMEWGDYGTNSLAIVDRINGKIVCFAPIIGFEGLRYAKNSSLLLVNSDLLDEYPGYCRQNYKHEYERLLFYKLSNGKLIKLK